MPMAVSGFFRSPNCHHFRMIHMLHGYARVLTNQTKGFFEDELHGIAIDHLDALHAVQHIAVRVPRISQKAVIGEFDVLSYQFAAVNRRLIVPFHTPAQMEDIGCIVQCFQRSARSGSTVKMPGCTSGPTLCRTSLL